MTEVISKEKMQFNIQKIRSQFPILNQTVNGKSLVYFDNGASTQKPQVVIDAIKNYYETINSNVHRGVHTLSQLATAAIEESREKIKNFINASSIEEIIFTSGTTDSINLVAHSYPQLLKQGDEIIISAMEHHSNIVPWQMACEKYGLKLKVIPMFENGELDLDAFEKLLSSKTKLVSLVYVSNSLGTINDIGFVIQKSHEVGAKVLIDGAQAVQHMTVDVQKLDCDFFCFSGHKLYGPTGIGVLYGKKEILELMPPYRVGGEMIKTVSFEKTTYNDLPFKFEAGTPHIEGGICLGTAIDFVLDTGLDNIAQHEMNLLKYAQRELENIGGIKFIGTAKNKTSVISFLVEGVHPYDTGVILDKLGVAVRTGHHCTQPIMDFLKIPGTVRASFAVYNTTQEIDIMIVGLTRVKKMFA
jgi:cysteine desulfurase/selenocysteine lyase